MKVFNNSLRGIILQDSNLRGIKISYQHYTILDNVHVMNRILLLSWDYMWKIGSNVRFVEVLTLVITMGL